jgi:hypothetical protein
MKNKKKIGAILPKVKGMFWRGREGEILRFFREWNRWVK